MKHMQLFHIWIMKQCHPSAPKNLLVSRKTLLPNTGPWKIQYHTFCNRIVQKCQLCGGRKEGCLYIYSGIQQKLPGVPTQSNSHVTQLNSNNILLICRTLLQTTQPTCLSPLCHLRGHLSATLMNATVIYQSHSKQVSKGCLLLDDTAI